MGRSFPSGEDGFCVRGLDLLGISGVVEPHEHFVAFIGRAAYSVAYDNDAIADVHRIQHGRKHANVSLRARDNQGVRLPFPEVRNQFAICNAE